MKKKDADTFRFNSKNAAQAKKIIAQYPKGREQSAILGLLDLAQRQIGGWIPADALIYISKILGMTPVQAYEIASFYSMFNLQPVGKYHLQICGTTPCALKGSEDIKKTCLKKLAVKLGQTTDDEFFTVSEVECLGACIGAPVVQINDEYHENLTVEKIQNLIDSLIK